MNQVLQTLRQRRSIRSYQLRQVDQNALDAILEAGLWAPSGMGMQSPVLVAMQDPETVTLLSRLNARVLGQPDADPFYGAPTVVVVLADTGRPTWRQDGSLVMGNLMNAAASLGVGSCGFTGRRRSSTCPRAGRCWKNGAFPPHSGAWATASLAMPTVPRRHPSPAGTVASCGYEETRHDPLSRLRTREPPV